MFSKRLTVICALLIGVSLVSARELERSEVIDLFSQLTSNPQKTWIDTGTIIAVHQRYQAPKTTDEAVISNRISQALSEYINTKDNPVKGEGLKKKKLDAIPFNVRHRLSNEFTMVTNNVMKFSGEKYYREIEVQSRTDSVKPGKGLEGNEMTENFRLDWNGKRIFAYNGEEFTMYTPTMNGALIDAAEKIPQSLGGEAVVGRIPWGYGYYTYDNLISMNCTAVEKVVDGEVIIELTFGNFSGHEVIISLLSSKDYSVASCITNKNDGTTVNKIYSDYVQVSGNWIPQMMIFEEFDNNSERVLSRNVWEFTSIDSGTPNEYDFEVDLLPDTLVEYCSDISIKNQVYINSANVNAKSLLADRLEYISNQGIKKQNCATASLRYSAKQFGIEINNTQMESIVDDKGYSSFLDIKQMAQLNGLNTKAVRVDIDNLSGLENNVMAIIYMPDKKHFLVLESVDSKYVRVIDFVSRKFNYRIDKQIFNMQWQEGVVLLISDDYINSNLQTVDDNLIATLKGNAGYECGYPLQEEAIAYCQMLQGECGSIYRIYWERWGCQAAESGTCNYNWFYRTSQAPCIEDLWDPWSCIADDNYWEHTWMQACL